MLYRKVLVFLLLLLCIPTAVPTNISYQGYLSLNGMPYEGATNLSFEILNESSVPIWTENDVLLDVKGGVYNHTLSVPVSFLEPTNLYYLHISVAGNSVSPDIPLMSVPYAYYARSVHWSNVRGKPPGFVDDIDNISSVWINQGGNLYYTNTGNVGIGTVSPGNKLTVTGIIESTNGGMLFPDGLLISGSNDITNLGADHLGNHIALRNISLSGSWLSGDGGDEGVFVNNAGYIGIGTNNPDSILHIAGGGDVIIEDVNNFNPNLYFKSSGTDLGLIYADQADTSLRLRAGGSGTHITILPSGNVGIGTGAPTAQLSLGELGSGYAGNASGTQLLLSGAHNTGVNSGGYKLRIEGYDNDGNVIYPIYVIDENSGTDFYLRNRPSAGGYSLAYFQGNVGIGTGGPADRLHVNGTIRGNSFHGVPWRSPKWFIVSCGGGAQGQFTPNVSGWVIRKYRMPFNVRIDGMIVSADDEANSSDFRFGLCVNSETVSTSQTYTEQLPDYGSVDFDMISSVNVTAGQYIAVICLIGNGAAEVTVWCYGRTIE